MSERNSRSSVDNARERLELVEPTELRLREKRLRNLDTAEGAGCGCGPFST